MSELIRCPSFLVLNSSAFWVVAVLLLRVNFAHGGIIEDLKSKVSLMAALETLAFGGGGAQFVWDVERTYPADPSFLLEMEREIEKVRQMSIREVDKARLIELHKQNFTELSKGGAVSFPVELRIDGKDLAYCRYEENKGMPTEYFFSEGSVIKKKSDGHVSIEDGIYGWYGKVGVGLPSMRSLRYLAKSEINQVEERDDGFMIKGVDPSSGHRLEVLLDKELLIPITFSLYRASGSPFEVMTVLESEDGLRFPTKVKTVLLRGDGSEIWSEVVTLKGTARISPEEIPLFRVSPEMRIYDRTVNPPIIFSGQDLLGAERVDPE